jgi:type I restriction enzyme S subunit
MKMSEQENNVVKYGAKEETVPEDWDVTDFGQVSEVSQGLQIAKSKRYKEPSDDRIKYITVQYLNDPDDRQNIWYIENPNDSVVCDKTDILMTRTGNTGEIITDVEGVYHNNFFVIDYSEDMNKKFLYEHLRTKKVQDLIMAYAGATTIPDLNHGDFYKIPVTIPSISEQRRIASVLYSVDEQIRTLTDRHDSLTQLKHGLMQDLLTGETSVTPEMDVRNEIVDGDSESEVLDSEWNTTTIGESNLKRYSGDTPSRSNGNYWNGSIKWISNSEVDDSITVPLIGETEETITEEGLENSGVSIIPEDSVVLSCTASIGKVAVNTNKMGTNQQFQSFSTPDKLNAMYLANYFRYHRDDLKSLSGSTTHEHLPVYMLDIFEIDVPPLWEQERIASVLYTVDEMIARTSDLIDEYKRLKRGLMQDLLSGDVRTPENLDVLQQFVD